MYDDKTRAGSDRRRGRMLRWAVLGALVAAPALSAGVATAAPTATAITVSVADPTPVKEHAGHVTFHIALSAVSPEPITVDYATSDGTATVAGNDYEPAVKTSFIIPAGKTQGKVQVTIDDDSIAEPTETFNFTIRNPQSSNGVTVSLGRSAAVGTILDDDALIVRSTSGSEPNTPATFSVALGEAYAGPVSFNYNVLGVTATAGSDFTATSGSHTFTAGDTGPFVINVPVRDDRNYELTETIALHLTNVTGGPAAPSADPRGFIKSNDPEPTLALSNAQVTEGTGTGTTTMVFSLRITGATAVKTFVHWSTANGGPTPATAGTDYTSKTGTVVFTPGKATLAFLKVNIVRDSSHEPNETLLVKLTSASNATITAGTGTGTIIDDD